VSALTVEAMPMPRHAPSAFLRATARRLRRSATEAETRLWALLRGHRFLGVGFRRQMPIGPYVVDFLCPAVRLVIEVDGGGHAVDGTIARDEGRTAWLAARGYRVVRFWNHEVLRQADAVLDRIFAELVALGAITIDAEPPHPVPPPRGGRGRNRRALLPEVTSETDAPAAPPVESAPMFDEARLPVPSPLEGEGQGGGAAAPAGPPPVPARFTGSDRSNPAMRRFPVEPGADGTDTLPDTTSFSKIGPAP
jgi:very-short-patch-repair endonuclease